MPADERTTRTPERCSLHPDSPSVARCAACGRPLCLTCVTPVRGLSLGSECLAGVLGPDAPAQAPRNGRGAGSARWDVVGVAFGVAVLASLLPWSRFGEGSGPFGAWGQSPRWSLIAAVAAVAGLGVWLVLRLSQRRPMPPWDLVEVVLAALVAGGALLALVRPPSFTRPWIGAWVAAAAGVVALVVALSARTASRGSTLAVRRGR